MDILSCKNSGYNKDALQHLMRNISFDKVPTVDVLCLILGFMKPVGIYSTELSFMIQGINNSNSTKAPPLTLSLLAKEADVYLGRQKV